MAITTIYTYPLTGSQREFTVPFEYLARRFVVLTLIGQDRKELVLTTDFRFISKTIVQTTVAWGPADGYERIEIRRDTSATDRLVDFADGSILRASELNISQIQTLHVAEEARNMVADTIAENSDGDLDARGRRLVNLADATSPDHAVTLRQEQAWAQSTLSNRNAAEAAALAANTSETNSKASEQAAKTSETNSKASEQAAKTSETNSKASEQAAKTSETNSKASEQAAKTSETNSKASEQAAKTDANRAEAYAAALNLPAISAQDARRLLRVDQAGGGFELGPEVQSDAGVFVPGQVALVGSMGGPTHVNYRHFKLDGVTNLNWNAVTSVGLYKFALYGAGENGPTPGVVAYFCVVNYALDGSNLTQLAIPYGLSGGGTRFLFRTRASGVWSAWTQLATQAEVKSDLNARSPTAWAIVDTSSGVAVLRESYNISSAVRTGTGLVTFTFSTPMDHTMYAVSGTGRAIGGGGVVMVSVNTSIAKTVNAASALFQIYSGSQYDVTEATVFFYGGKS